MIQKCSDSARHAGLTRCVPLASTQENKRMGDEHEVKVERDAGLCREKKKGLRKSLLEEKAGSFYGCCKSCK